MTYARVDSLEALQTLKIAMVKFAEAATVALADAESEVSRTMMWLEGEQTTYWASQIRKRKQIVERCQQALRDKKLFKDAFGRQQSTIDEEKALRRAVLHLEAAEHKALNTKKYINVMRRESQNFKGGMQRFHTCVESDIPAAIAQLSNMLATLKEYVAAAPRVAGSEVQTSNTPAGSMARSLGPDENMNPAADKDTTEGEG